MARIVPRTPDPTAQAAGRSPTAEEIQVDSIVKDRVAGDSIQVGTQGVETFVLKEIAGFVFPIFYFFLLR